MPTTTSQNVQPNHATANDYSIIAKLQKRQQTNAVIAHHKPITWPQNPAANKKIVPIDYV